MKGIVRGVDKNRRVVIPKAQLQAAGIKPGDLLGIYSDIGIDGVPVIILSKYQEGCALCGGQLDSSSVVIHHHHICQDCQEQVQIQKGSENPCQTKMPTTTNTP